MNEVDDVRARLAELEAKAEHRRKYARDWMRKKRASEKRKRREARSK